MYQALILCAFTVLCIVFSPHPASAQSLLTYRFTAEIVEAEGEGRYLDSPVAVGDQLTGRFDFQANSPVAHWNTNPDRGRQELLIGESGNLAAQSGQNAFMAAPSNRAGNAELVLNTYRTRPPFGDCYTAITLSAAYNIAPNEPGTPGYPPDFEIDYTTLSLTFSNTDCDFEFDYLNTPEAINLEDWTSELVIEGKNLAIPESAYNIRARLTSISLEEEFTHTISGLVLEDINTNCSADETDTPVRGAMIFASPGLHSCRTDADGKYTLKVPAGDYSVKVLNRGSFTAACAPDGEEEITISLNTDNPNAVHEFLRSQANVRTLNAVLYHDASASCTRDDAETVIPNQQMIIVPGLRILTSDGNGRITSELPYGTYRLFPASNQWNPYWRNDCAAESSAITLHAETAQTEFEIGLASNDLGQFRGEIFYDSNRDCEHTSGEANLKNHVLEIQPGNYFLGTGSGSFRTYLPIGSYTARLRTNGKGVFNNTCTGAQTSFTISNNAEVIDAQIALQPGEAAQALTISLTTSQVLQDSILRCLLYYKLAGNELYIGNIQMNFPPELTVANIISEPVSVGDSTIIFQSRIGHFSREGSYLVDFRLPDGVELAGREYCITAEALKQPNIELIKLRSRDRVCATIGEIPAANSMRVFANGNNADGEIKQSTRVLTYIVDYQNTTGEFLDAVSIINKLSPFHTLDHIELGFSSDHSNLSLQFNEAGDPILEFRNLHLPPSSMNDSSSRGFVQYHIFLKEDLQAGTEIPIYAEIEYGEDVIARTNTVVSRISGTPSSVFDSKSDQGIAVRVFPNPSSDKLTVQFAEPQQAELILNNALGQTLLTSSIYGTSRTIDISKLAAGTYFLAVRSNRGTIVKTVQKLD